MVWRRWFAGHRSRRIGLALFVVSYAALVAAWLVGNPLGRAPDEPLQYVRALGVGSGQIFGERTKITWPGYTDAQREWSDHEIRIFDLPAHLSLLPAVPCNITDPNQTARCQNGWPGPAATRQISYVGSYQPFAYAPAGVVMRTASTPWMAYILGRATIAALALLLLGLAVRAFWHDALPSLSLFGLALAVTPMAVFLAASLSASGVEIAGAVCYVAGLLAVARGRPKSTSAWLAVGAGGVALGISRSLGPYFVVGLAGVVAVSIGLRAAWQLLRSSGRRALVAGVAVVVASGLNFLWDATQMPHLNWKLSLLAKSNADALPRAGREMIGVFGWLEAGLPRGAINVWAVLTLGLVVLAIVLGSWYERIAIAGVIVGAATLIAAFHAVLLPESGFDVQGRHLLPLAVGVPLLAADVILRHRRRLKATVIGAAAVGGTVVTAALQVLAWYGNARRYAVGVSGPTWFFRHAQWSPPGGWHLWIVVAVLGGASLALAAVVSALPAAQKLGRANVTSLPSAQEPLVGVD
jgi:hypothetical protein